MIENHMVMEDSAWKNPHEQEEITIDLEEIDPTTNSETPPKKIESITSGGITITKQEFWNDIINHCVKKEWKQAVNMASDNIILFDKFVTMFDTEELWYYEAGVYKPVGDSIIKHILQSEESISIHLNKNFIAEVIASVKRKTYIQREDFEAPINLICVKNGIFDLKEKKLISHSPNYYFKSKINVAYKPKADCPHIKKFISEIVEEKHYYTAFEIISYMMYRSHFIQKAFMLSGDGDNGKSRYIDLIECFVGKENLSNEQLQDLCHNGFSKAELYGRLGNLCADLPATIMENTGDFKKLTGYDTISAQRKFAHPFGFKSYAVMVFSANEVPESKDNTDAFYKRWEIIEFPFKFRSDLPDKEYVGNIKKADKNILEKLTTKEELEGLLKVCIDLLIDMLDRQDFKYVTPLEEIKIKYNLKSNSAVVFVENYLTDDYEFGSDEEPFVIKDYVWKEYLKFCKYNHTMHKSSPIFFREIKERWGATTEKKTIELGERKNCFVGIRYLASWEHK